MKPTYKTGHDYLNEMCSFKANFNAFEPRVFPITNRVVYIQNQLKQIGCDFETDYFNADNPEKCHIAKKKFVNLYAKFKGNNAEGETIIFLAHHDVKNIHSQNCQDNTASVCNLLHLCETLKGKELKRNVVIAFTDAEENCDFTKCGAKRLALLINSGTFGKVSKAINLELTANGNELWASAIKSVELLKEMKNKFNARIVSTPYNDGVVLERNGIESVCIGTLTRREVENVAWGMRGKGYGYCSTWALCHSNNDTFDKANGNEMKNLVENVLMKMALE
jgi:hypothetical protein